MSENDTQKQSTLESKPALKQLIYAGDMFYSAKNYPAAITVYQTAEILSKDIDIDLLEKLYLKLGNSYYELNEIQNKGNQFIDQAAYYYEQYLKCFPDESLTEEVWWRLGYAYYFMNVDKGIDCFNKALNIAIVGTASINKLFSMIKSDSYDQQDIKEESEFEAEIIKNKLYNNPVKYNHENKKVQKNRKLNIGYLSSDCRAHVMMNYIIPIWKHHNRDEFNVFIFSTTFEEDSTTNEIKDIGLTYVKCPHSVKDTAKEIYDRNIDILIDITGYTDIMAYCALYKPAPIIISYLGYLNTLGMKEVDYILSDKYIIPEDKAYLYTEKPLYIDKYHIFEKLELPNVKECPYKENGYITFGSFNCPSKINSTMLYIWSEILKNVDNSKLLIFRTDINETLINHFKLMFEALGISEDRVIYDNKTNGNFFNVYSRADIALDTYPFNGMTILTQLAIAGVPSITLLGEGMQSRTASRTNELIGNKDLVANNIEEYIEIAKNLANNKERLNYLRHNLRQDVYNSELMVEPEVFTKDLEIKFKEIWQTFINT